MCGITGIYAFNQIGRLNMINLAKATASLESRGPDNQGLYNDEFVGLGHRRLSIIDTSSDANQPMTNASGRYIIIYNGEIYNYKTLRLDLESSGFSFNSDSDTEVLLNLYIRDKEACVHKINGFFAFAIYDKQEQNLFIGRDRYGIKPLYYYLDDDKLLFASELKSIFAYGIEKSLDFTMLYTYLKLNYVPAPDSMLKGVKKLLPGQYLNIKNGQLSFRRYYTIVNQIQPFRGDFKEAVKEFSKIMEESVVSRLVADVPLGTFLSGGLDSTVVSALAARHVDQLQTFSIGFKDEPFFDETDYANKAATLLKTNHSVFKLGNNDLYQHIFDMLDYLDEPFADSSALAVYILAKETRKKVTVALSGDGADELFAGYNKHAALLKMQQPGLAGSMVGGLGPLWKMLPKSRNNGLTNKIRQLEKYAIASKLAPAERYWLLASIGTSEYALKMLVPNNESIEITHYENLKRNLLDHFGRNPDINDYLRADLQLVLPNDMLTKVDLMSMAHGLEVRVPFLDKKVVEFAFSLPVNMKITATIRKRVVQEAFRSIIPKEIYNRPKKGFEVPLLKWLRNEMRPLITNDLLNDDFIEAQGIFSLDEIRKLKTQLFSTSSGDAHAKIWALIVFQWWWKKHFTL